MSVNLIAFLLGIILVISSFIYVPIKRKQVSTLAGNCIYGFSKNKQGLIIAVDMVAMILIVLVLFMNYSPFVSLVLCGCGVLGAWIVAGEAALSCKYGIYDNGIIAIGKYIPYDDIVTFPVLNLPKSDQKNHPDNILVIATRKYGNIEIVFDSNIICNEVVSKLKEMKVIK